MGEKFIVNDEFRNYLAKNITTTFKFNCVTKDDVSKIVKYLKSTSSPGYDGIPISVIKDNLDSLLDAIAYICNLSLQTGVFPQKLMIAVVVAIFKSGDSQMLENYRPISILVALSKILEKIVVHQIVNYFVSSNYFSDCQFAFRNNLSTADAIHKIVDFIYTAFDLGQSVVGAFLNLAKAFDTINRDILYKKLNYYGVKGTELKCSKDTSANENK